MNKIILIKYLKNKYLTKKIEKYKIYYKKILRIYSFLKDIADPCFLKPIKGDLRKYQLSLLNFANSWLKKFEEQKLSYFLISGNLLGAYRNKGFIPWDDDFDIGMMRNDFSKLIDYLRQNYLEVDVSNISYSKKNRSSVINEHIKKYQNDISFAVFPTHLQIFCGDDMKNLQTLDIHPYDYYDESITEDEFKEYIEEIKNKKVQLDNFAEINNYFKKNRESNKFVVELSNRIYFGIDNYDFNYLKFNGFFEYDDIFPLKNLIFENSNFYAPQNIEKFLLLNYGKNYMDMPKELYLNSHILYRENLKNRQSNTKHDILLKHLKRKLFPNLLLRYKELYKLYKKRVDILLQIIDIKSLKPCNETVLRAEQLKCVEFCSEITNLFEKNDLKYFITSGTLIGAVRHKGFIPWDDDFDVGMMRNDYEQLKVFLRNNFKEILVNEISIAANNKQDIVNKELIKSNGEKVLFFIGPKFIQIYKGHSLLDCCIIDIFPHEYYSEDYTIEKHLLYMKTIKQDEIKLNHYSKIIDYLNNKILYNKNIVKKSSIIYYGIDSLGSYIVNPTTLMTQNMIFPLKKMKFENFEFYAPNDPDGYIKVQYKDYWNFPKNFEISPDLDKRLNSQNS